MLTLFIVNEIDKMFSYLSLLFSLCLSLVSPVLANVLSFSCYFCVVSCFSILFSWFPVCSLIVSLVKSDRISTFPRLNVQKQIGFLRCCFSQLSISCVCLSCVSLFLSCSLCVLSCSLSVLSFLSLVLSCVLSVSRVLSLIRSLSLWFSIFVYIIIMCVSCLLYFSHFVYLKAYKSMTYKSMTYPLFRIQNVQEPIGFIMFFQCVATCVRF